MNTVSVLCAIEFPVWNAKLRVGCPFLSAQIRWRPLLSEHEANFSGRQFAAFGNQTYLILVPSAGALDLSRLLLHVCTRPPRSDLKGRSKLVHHPQLNLSNGMPWSSDHSRAILRILEIRSVDPCINNRYSKHPPSSRWISKESFRSSSGDSEARRQSDNTELPARGGIAEHCSSWTFLFLRSQARGKRATSSTFFDTALIPL